MKRFISVLMLSLIVISFSVSTAFAQTVITPITNETNDGAVTGLDIDGKIGVKFPRDYGYDGTKGLIFSPDFSEQAVIAAEETNIDNFDRTPQSELSNLGAVLVEEAKSRGAESSEICEFSGRKFIKIAYAKGGAYKSEFVTVHNGVMLRMKWLADSTTSSEKNILSNLIFADAANSDFVPSFLYTQEQSGVAFFVPDNWELTHTDEMNDYLYTAMFRPVGRNNVTLEYACRNMYGASGSAVTPEEYTDNLNVKNEIINIIGLDGSAINTETMGQKSYVYGVVELKEEVTDKTGLKIIYDRIYLISFSAGFVHIFNYSAPENSSLYDEVRDLVSSTAYPGKVSNLVGIPRKVTKTNVTQTVVEEVIGGESGGIPVGLIAALIGVVAVVIIIIAVVLLRNSKRAPMPEIPVPDIPEGGTERKENIFNIDKNMQNNPNIIFCHNCNGSVNIMLHLTCPKCGAPVPGSKAGMNASANVPANAPAQNAPVQNAPAENAPVQNVPVQNAPVQNAPAENAPVQNASAQNVPVQNVPEQPTNVETSNENG